jgi:branched-chain amino acid transport system permease protein
MNALLDFIEFSLSGLSVGAIYALTAIGFVIVYKATRIINFAIGEMMMLGAYFFFGLVAQEGIPFWAAIPIALAGTGAFAALAERLVFRRLIGESPTSSFMVTIGLASILVGIVEIVWTSESRTLPTFLPDKPIFVPVGSAEAFVASKNAWGFVISATALALIIAGFRFWRGGVALRATAADGQAAYSVGIDVPRVYSLAWALGGVTAAGAGILVGSIAGISSAMGAIGLSVIVVVIVGGLDSIGGALVGGLLVGWLESMASWQLGAEYKQIAAFVVLLLVLIVKPYGLFGTHDIERL